MQVKVEQIEEGGSPCGCGRSPTGKCIGWHGLTEEQYWDRLRDYNAHNTTSVEDEQFPTDIAISRLNVKEIYGQC